MAPARMTRDAGARALVGFLQNQGVATRSRSGAKRKADSPANGARTKAKRAAFGDITNAIGRFTRSHDKKPTVLKASKKKSAILEEPAPPAPPAQTRKKAASEACVPRVSDRFDDTSLYVSAVEDVSDVSSEKESLARDIDLLAIADGEPPGVPAGVDDFDKENWNDPFQVSVYAMDIFDYLKSREPRFTVENYMSRQTDITGWMRALLVDWMVEVQESFELNHETLYLAVKLVDLYLSKKSTKKDELQLLGSASLFVAAKYDERVPPLVDDFLYICDGAYTLRQLLSMEMDILKTIGFDLGAPLSYRFLRRYARCARVSMPTLTLARFILESCLMEYSLISLSDSLMAAAALYLALRMKSLGTWTETHAYYTGYKLKDILYVAKLQNAHLHKKPKEGLSTVRNKYSHKIFFEVAKIPLISDGELT